SSGLAECLPRPLPEPTSRSYSSFHRLQSRRGRLIREGAECRRSVRSWSRRGNDQGAAMRLEGIHQITAITADAPGNVDFYARLLGLRLVKKTVNQDDPTVYHLFYADERGSPGSDITFFEYPGAR